MRGHYKVNDCNKCMILLWDIDSGRGCPCLCTGQGYTATVFSTQFYHESKTALKNKACFEKYCPKSHKDSRTIWGLIVITIQTSYQW